MTKNNLDAFARAKMLRNFFRHINGSMLAAGAAERNHDVFKSAAFVVADGCINK
jgi:hypothetical protein